jgi:phenylpyruvate tautomerase PptA (4-oxalocrotonate tautomerase family)
MNLTTEEGRRHAWVDSAAGARLVEQVESLLTETVDERDNDIHYALSDVKTEVYGEALQDKAIEVLSHLRAKRRKDDWVIAELEELTAALLLAQSALDKELDRIKDHLAKGTPL